MQTAAVRSALSAPLFPSGNSRNTGENAAIAAGNAALVAAYQAEADEGKKQAYMNELVEKNLRLVHKVAGQYRNALEHSSFEYEDLVQEGVFGLYRAAEKYDPSMGSAFGTYAVIWIRSVIGRALKLSSPTIRVSVRQAEVISKASRAKEQFISDHGRRPTTEELAEASGLSRKQIEEAWLAYSRMNPASLDEPLADEDGEITLGDTLADSMDVQEEALRESADRELLEDLKKILPEKEFDIVCRRNGIGPYESPQTFMEISGVYGISRQRAEQVEKVAYRRLRKKLDAWCTRV